MNYKWKLSYLMKNGERLVGIYEGPENDSLAVANKLYTLRPQDFASHFGEDKNSMILVKIEEIAAVSISKYEISSFEKKVLKRVKEKKNG